MNSNAYQLFMSLRSPFARRIRLALNRLQIPYTETVLDVFTDNPDLWAANPIGTVPTLITPDLGPLSDSSHLLEYFHEKTGAIWPADFSLRSQVRQASVFAEGIMQASVLYFQETKVHEVPSVSWVQDYFQTAERTLKRISEMPSHLFIQKNELTQAGWDVAGALEYLDIRIPEIEYQNRYSNLIPILELARKNPKFVETRPQL